MLRIFNTMNGKVEPFEPMQDKLVRMYSCGPTVYDYGHIGNFRTFVFVDLLRRYLKLSGYKLEDVMNITDVDDKIIRNAAQHNQSVRQYAEKYEQAFLEDMRILNLEQPEQIVRATEHIPQMAHFIQGLVDKGFAYRADDGSYYFRIAKFPEYGKLSKKDFSGMETGARVDVDEYDKENPGDFALWKAPKPGEASWETEIGPGRPGWHIECSVMAREHLGDTLDMHLGGEDLVFPHHENEIAQSEALTGKPFAHYWVHCRFLLVEGDKMSKSKGNFYTLRDLLLMGHKASSVRFLLSSVPHTKQLNFTFDGLKQAAASVMRLRNFKDRVEGGAYVKGPENPAVAASARTAAQHFKEALDDDLNTARALGAVFDMVRDVNVVLDSGHFRPSDAPEVLSVLHDFDSVFDVLTDNDAEKTRATLEWAKSQGRELTADQERLLSDWLSDAQIEQLIADRSAAKKSRDFGRADAIRNQLSAAGILIEDTKDGIRWKRK